MVAVHHIPLIVVIRISTSTGEEVFIDKQVACEECLKKTGVACEKTVVAVC